MGENNGDLSDEALYAASSKGDALAFRALVRRHAAMVHRLALNILGDAGAAEDAAQEVFLSVWTQDRWTPGEAKFTTWLSRVAINKAIDHRRRRAPVAIGDDAVHALVESEIDLATTPTQQARLEQAESAERLRRAMEKLPEAQRQALVLFYFAEQDIDSIAQTMNSTGLAVRSLLKRGRQGLKTSLQKQKKICEHGRRNVEGGD